MRDRALPAALFSLLGIANRIAVRMGLHRDGHLLGLGPLRTEERRRVWWQLQYLELTISAVVGSMSLTIFADWDTALPANLEDDDFQLDLETMPPERKGLTSMSHCLWRYRILYMQRQSRPTSGPVLDIAWLLSPHVPTAEKDAQIDITEKTLANLFLQHCELLNPLHIYIQVGIRQLVLAARRTARQPALVNAKISEMSMAERDDFLDICIKGLEYYMISQTTESLEGFKWHNENYFQWPSCKYSIIS